MRSDHWRPRPNLNTEQTVADLTAMLAAAAEEVRRAILRYKDLGFLPDNKLAALEGLKILQTDIQETTSRLHRELTLLFRKTAKTSFPQGVYRGIDEFAAAQLPFYRDLTPEGINKLATRVFTLVDTDALVCMTNYNLVLAGAVNRELADGIKRTIMSGIATGKGADDIVRDLGRVVKDPESFRYADSKVFTKAKKAVEQTAAKVIVPEPPQIQILPWRLFPIHQPLDFFLTVDNAHLSRTKDKMPNPLKAVVNNLRQNARPHFTRQDEPNANDEADDENHDRDYRNNKRFHAFPLFHYIVLHEVPDDDERQEGKDNDETKYHP
jgi:hypothetical protein